MAELKIVKNNEKVLIWLHREEKTQVWLADKLNVTRQAISQKIKDNSFTPFDLLHMKQLGMNID